MLGTERHESRRIDNQLRGRTGRQGDPGRSKFFLSCEDDLLRIFAGDRLDAIMRTFGVEEGEAITHKWLNSAIATAQKRVEQRNYEIRKNLLKYDDVVNDQRKAVFEQRHEFMESDDLSADRHRDAPRHHRRPGRPPPAAQGLCRPVGRRRACTSGWRTCWAWICRSRTGRPRKASPTRKSPSASAPRPTPAPPSARPCSRPSRRGSLEKNFLLQMVDLQWREHLTHLDHLRNVIGLRGYGQRDPLNEYKTEAFSLFESLIGDLRQNVTRWMMTVEFQFAGAGARRRRRMFEIHMDPLTGQNERALESPAPRWAPERRSSARPCRSRPCPPASSAPAATPPAPAARARSSSTATGRWSRHDETPLPSEAVFGRDGAESFSQFLR